MRFKILSAAVVLALLPMAVFAETETETETDINVNADLEEQVASSQPVILTPSNELEEGVIFSGYARYGLHYSDDIKHYVLAEGQLAGNATGRLGNEGNGGEFQFAKAFQNEGGALWDLVLMLENWSKYQTNLESGETVSEYGDVALKKFYAGGTNVFASQPNAYIWAGRDFHQRPQQDLNDYFWMTHDGQGGGIYNLELGAAAKLDFSVVGQVDGPGDNGNYAFTSKLHSIGVTDSINMSVLFNYGFENDQYDEDGNRTNEAKISAYQVAAVFDQNWSQGRNQLIVRYADNTDTSVYSKVADLTTLFVSVEGLANLDKHFSLAYLAGYHNSDTKPADEARTNYSAIMRPMYSWNATHSTWVEAGYSLVDYEQGGKNTAWKVTLSQNVTLNTFANSRPMLRFYATVGEADNQIRANELVAAKQDTLALGAMFEAWW
ncbi:carbohydrate porin [Agarivorans sp. MS3-6]